mmetsp:Transcript_35288/g.79657  ORF Transcript_35288/g.79657 Transcript_35288/m.79657 type:complete len:254 (-) Transcript_35288:43-804(-)
MDAHGAEMVAALREHGWWASDGPILPPRMRSSMRQEVEALWAEGHFKLSQSVRGTEYYDKDHVYATEIDGSKYGTAPRLAHYTVNATQAIAARIGDAFPEARLSDKYIGNKLNFCVGEGASFDPHLDLGVAEKPFNRKLTVLLYLNSSWRPALGGEIALLGEGATEEAAALHSSANPASSLPVRLAPTAGRMVVFWSDRMLHKVEASQAPEGLDDYRASYTIWLCTEEPAEAKIDAGARAAGGYEAAPSFASF